MQIVKYNPFNELRKMERNLGGIWGGDWRMHHMLEDTSAMDLYEEDGNLIAEVSLPTYAKNEVKVNAERGALEISAEHSDEQEKKDKRQYYFQESSSQYFRRVTLPEGANTTASKASFKDGVLRIVMPMEATKETETIPID